MNLTEIRIIKRDGKQENFSAAKITNAIGKAFEATGIPQQREELDLITRQVVSHFSQPTMGVEEIQDLVENELMKVQPEVAKKYIIYRQWRNTERDRKTHIKHIMDGIVAIDKNDVNLSNANMSSHTPAGQMMTLLQKSPRTIRTNIFFLKNMQKRIRWVTYIFTTWIIIPQRRLPAYSMT